MLGYVDGKVLSVDDTTCMVLVNNIGYEISVHLGVQVKLSVGNNVALYIHQVIREDAHTLYGFIDPVEKKVFRLVLQASGVGPKLAMTLLGAFPGDSLIGVIQHKRIDALKAIKGVGARVAEKMVVELQPKVAKWYVSSGKDIVASQPLKPVVHEALQALTQLGYQMSAIQKRVEALYEEGMSTELLLRKSLQALG